MSYNFSGSPYVVSVQFIRNKSFLFFSSFFWRGLRLFTCSAYRNSPWISIRQIAHENFPYQRLPLSSHSFPTVKGASHMRTIRIASFKSNSLAKSSLFSLVSRIPYTSMQCGRRLWTLKLPVHQRLSTRYSFPLLVSVSCFGTFFSSSTCKPSSSPSSFSTRVNDSSDHKSDPQLSHGVNSSTKVNEDPFHYPILPVDGTEEKFSHELDKGDKHNRKQTDDSGRSNCLLSFPLNSHHHRSFPSFDPAPPLHPFISSSLPPTLEKCRMEKEECQSSLANAWSKNSDLHCNSASRWAPHRALHCSPSNGPNSSFDSSCTTRSDSSFTSSPSSVPETCSQDYLTTLTHEENPNSAVISSSSSPSEGSFPRFSYPFYHFSNTPIKESDAEAQNSSHSSLGFYRSFGVFGNFTGFMSSRGSPFSPSKEKDENTEKKDSGTRMSYDHLESDYYPDKNVVYHTREGQALNRSHEIDEERKKTDRNKESESEEKNRRKTMRRAGEEKQGAAISAFHAAQLSNKKTWSCNTLSTPEEVNDTRQSSFHNGFSSKDAPQGSSYFAGIHSPKDSEMKASRRSFGASSSSQRSEMTARAMHMMTTQYYLAYKHWNQWYAFNVDCQNKINSLRYYLWRLDLYAFHQVNAVLQRLLLLIFLFMLGFWQSSSSFSILPLESDSDRNDTLKNVSDPQAVKRLSQEKVCLRWDNLTDLPLVSAEEYQRCRTITQASLSSSSDMTISSEMKSSPTSPAKAAKTNSSSDGVDSQKTNNNEKK